MAEDKIKNLLQNADRKAGRPVPIYKHLAGAVRHRAAQRRLINAAVPIAAAAIVLLSLSLWYVTTKNVETTQDQDKIASIQAQVRQLEARTDATLNLIQDVLDYEQKQRRLEELRARLAAIPDPLEEVRKQVEKTAFILVYQADRMLRELNQRESAVQTYNRVIQLFPQTRSAGVAKQRLSEIQNNSAIKNNAKI